MLRQTLCFFGRGPALGSCSKYAVLAARAVDWRHPARPGTQCFNARPEHWRTMHVAAGAACTHACSATAVGLQDSATRELWPLVLSCSAP